MRLLIAMCLSFGLMNQTDPAMAKSGDVVAVRWWGQACVSIETQWGHRVVIDPYGLGIGYDDPKLSADLVLVTHGHGDHSNVEIVGGNPQIVHGLDDEGAVRELHHYLGRAPNQAKAAWRVNTKADSAEQPDHSVFVRSIATWHDASEGAERGANAMFLIFVDGLKILHCGDLGHELSPEQIRRIGQVDVLLLPVGGVYTIDGLQAAKLTRQLKPRFVVPMHYKTDVLNIPLQPVTRFVSALGEAVQTVTPRSNTLPVRAGGPKPDKTQLVLLPYKPWQPTGELASLMQKMDASCQASQKVFAPLSARQMSWQPPNGTHTPRWNTEHMMGRQLLFFSQIYAAIDPTFAPIDLNPKQMPTDYRPAHDDWTGAEEARQMQRANAYVRRFGYLLEGTDLDARAPGSRWTLRRLLKQMDRHYSEHTANVTKKFDLEGWPRE